MDLRFDESQEAFRAEVRGWLADHLVGEFEVLRGRGGPGDDHDHFELRLRWERLLAEAGWTCLGWPEAHGGRGASLLEEVVFYEEYVRAGGPGRLGHIGETLLGPTIIAFGSEAQKARYLPPIRAAEEFWCQGYSEPNAGSDLANVQTRAVPDGDGWRVTGQKIWTSHATWADHCFVVARTDPESKRHKGLSYLLVPMKQAGVDIRPIQQITGTSEFCEVFFDEAAAPADAVVGGEGNGWKVAMATLAFERGASTLGQQLAFTAEFEALCAAAKAHGAAADPLLRQRLAQAWIELRIMRLNALRTLSHLEGNELSRAGMITKLFWATWHRDLGELAMDVLGAGAERCAGPDYDLTEFQRLFLFSRSDTIYAGSNEIQRNIIGERALGLPREPRVSS